ncbi:unnamed protein product [Brassicogethes aeneus]|uniref:Uncharacterized protein n=1 Tax=Brassicogethes aeneus TaxID=1431903 RepID=A0A9P0BDC7_BRAAE|nr:unnamed protein product [Brassicogethes aeneus]
MKDKETHCCKCGCHGARKYFFEYCENTSIHGVKYFAQKRTKLEVYNYNNYAVWVCEEELRGKNLRNQYYSKILTNDIYNFLNESKLNFFHYCYWMGYSIPCEKYFVPILTEEGVCYSLNFLDHSELFQDDVYSDPRFYQVGVKSTWNVEDGYPDKKFKNHYPIRALLTGVGKSLSVILYSRKSNIDEKCASDDSGGFFASIDLPGKLPRMSDSLITIGSNINVLGSIQPEIITTSVAVKNYPPDKRDCFFQDEKPLRFFKIYTQSNCLLECFTNITLQNCECVPFYMPRTNSTPLCGLGLYKCIEVAEYESLASGFDFMETESERCDCRPLCSDINYNIETSQNVWKNNKVLKTIGTPVYEEEKTEISESYDPPDLYLEKDDKVEFSSLTLYMRRNHLETKQRNEVYGFIDFLCGFGGLLGLFTGFSLLSLMEIIYFLSLRIFGNYQQNN